MGPTEKAVAAEEADDCVCPRCHRPHPSARGVLDAQLLRFVADALNDGAFDSPYDFLRDLSRSALTQAGHGFVADVACVCPGCDWRHTPAAHDRWLAAARALTATPSPLVERPTFRSFVRTMSGFVAEHGHYDGVVGIAMFAVDLRTLRAEGSDVSCYLHAGLTEEEEVGLLLGIGVLGAAKARVRGEG